MDTLWETMDFGGVYFQGHHQVPSVKIQQKHFYGSDKRRKGDPAI